MRRRIIFTVLLGLVSITFVLQFLFNRIIKDRPQKSINQTTYAFQRESTTESTDRVVEPPPPNEIVFTATVSQETITTLTATSIPNSIIEVKWERITTANGLCTDSPRFLFGSFYIGSEGSTFCYSDGREWRSLTIPLHATVNAVLTSGGLGLFTATQKGMCVWTEGGTQPHNPEWQCPPKVNSYPTDNILAFESLFSDFAFLFPNAVGYGDQIYRFSDIVGDKKVRSTSMAISGKVLLSNYPEPEIWIGTENHGIVVIQPIRKNIFRITRADGLPSDHIRDINSETCNSPCQFRDIWVATDQGVGHWDGKQWIQFSMENGLPSNDVLSVDSERQNTAWVATVAGASFFNGLNWQILQYEDQEINRSLREVDVLGNEVWFTTQGYGLLHLYIQAQP